MNNRDNGLIGPFEELLFVYGTLKSSYENNHPYLSDSIFLCEAKTKGCLYENSRFPILVEGTDDIYGELYIVSYQELDVLDAHEGCPEYYYRSVQTCWDIKTGERFRAFVYRQDKDDITEEVYNPSGVWHNASRKLRIIK